ncbi:MAG: bifunctional response regulator/alkaline phosphatase family protein [Chitinophagales bacterium]|nr:bifunctional response regulator/alkaline phosphatase family protein [Chitinophagales bacterium]
MSEIKILWADDEIDLLKPQIMFLEQKGYDVTPVTNGIDAIEKFKTHDFDIVFLDESMPGISGLETLSRIKAIHQDIPVVLITKNEEEYLMEEAIGSQITDYLIKPVKPQQILLSLKKIIDNKRLVSEKTGNTYRQEFQKIMMQINNEMTHQEWADLYRQLIFWELQLDQTDNQEMHEILNMQKSEANKEFFKFISKNYLKWVGGQAKDAPTLSNTLFRNKVKDYLNDDIPTFFLLIDNLRYDQFKVIEPFFNELFKKTKEDNFYSILPSTTQYSRNAIFSGLMPLEIYKKYSDKWFFDDDEESKNLHEQFFLEEQLKNFRFQGKSSYTKVTTNKIGKELEDNILNFLNTKINVIVYNFVDMLSHARTEMEVLKELASDEAAYRSLTVSWFDHSPLFNALQKLKDKKVRIIVTADHGTIRVQSPAKVIGDKNTTTNLRYKTGKSLNYNSKEVFEVRKPAEAMLPQNSISSSYIFAREDYYLCYPNNYNYYVNYYKNTFQHGGVSMEEMIVPFIVFESK